jgi:uncharacterized protein YjdB
MAVMVVNAAKLDTVAAGNVFTDENKISAWAKGSVNTASSYKIISGYPNNSFQPQLSATRAEAMVVINQAIFKTVPGAAITGLGILQLGENTTAIASTTEPGAGGWTSSDKTVAKVNVNTGAVVALKAGTTEIGYTLSTSEKVNSKTITVYPEPIVNNPTIGVVRVGSGTVKPASYDVPDATETITWNSTDTAIATIDKKTGEITTVKAGDTIITYEVVKKTTGNIIAKGSLAITVKPAAVQGAPVIGIGLLQIGETITATASTTEPGARGWTSSNSAVATVDAATGSIKALAAGTANIGYTISASGNINSKVITVYAAPTINNPSIGVVKVGAGTITPTGFTKPAAGETIGWTSSDPSRATINSATGAITPVAAGDTTISYAVIKTSRIIAMGYLIVAVQA